MLDWCAVRGLWIAAQADLSKLRLRQPMRSHIRDVMVNGEWVVRRGCATRWRKDSSTLRSAPSSSAGLARSAEEANPARPLAPDLRPFYATWEDEQRT